MSENIAVLLAVGIVVIGVMVYTIIDRLRFGRWIDRPNNREVNEK